MRKLLVIDGDPESQQTFRRIFDSPGLQIMVAAGVGPALISLTAIKPDVLILDLNQAGETSLQGLRRIRELDGRLPIVVISSPAAIHAATESVRLGAYSYLLKPFDIPKLQRTVLAALEAAKEMGEVLTFDASPEHTAPLCWIGQSPAMRRVLELLERVSSGDSPVLITGEPGSGKRLIARAIYQRGKRNQQLFLPVNCEAIPETLLGSELFGNERAALVPFLSDRIGRLEQCGKGTLLLHEICALPLDLQEKVLRAARGGAFERIGGGQKIRVDVRLIATSRKCPDPAAAPDQFHPGLLALPDLARIRLPPLRDRKEDIRPLAKYFVKDLSRDVGQTPRSLSAKALAILENYHWPGNIRELKEVVQKALVSANGVSILPSDLPPHLKATGSSNSENGRSVDLHVSRKSPAMNSEELARLARKLFLWAQTDSELKVIPAIERELVINALVETKGNQLHAARLLGITRATLRKRVAKFKIEQELSFG